MSHLVHDHDKKSISQEKRRPQSESQGEDLAFVQQAIPAADVAAQLARLNPGSLSPAMILQLQRTIGNQAAMRLIGCQPAGPSGDLPPLAGFLVQRQNDRGRRAPLIRAPAITPVRPAPGFAVQRAVTGLARGSSMQGFASKLVAWKKKNGAKALADLARQLVTYANAELTKAGVYNVLANLSAPGNVDGQFDFGPWTIDMNPASFTQRHGITKVSQLTVNEVSNIADTVYHESRHAEQWFRMAQYLAGKGKSAAQIMSQMGIANAKAAQAAVAAPLKKPGKGAGAAVKAKYRETLGWYKSVEGSDANYRNAVLTAQDNLDSVQSKIDPIKNQKTFKAAKAGVDSDMTKLKKRRTEFKTEKLRLKAIKKRSPLERRMLIYSSWLIVHLNRLIKGWSKLKKFPGKARFASRVQTHLTKATSVDYKAYRHLPEEADAWKVGNKAGARVKTKLKPKKKAKTH